MVARQIAVFIAMVSAFASIFYHRLLILSCAAVAFLLSQKYLSRIPTKWKLRLAMSTVLLCSAVVLVNFIVSAHDRAETAAREGTCMSNMRRIIMAFSAYADDHDGRLPSHLGWPKALLPYVGSQSIYHCPNDRRPTVGMPQLSPLSPMMLSYAMPSTASGVRFADVKRTRSFPLLFESMYGAPCPRHGDWYLYGFADGRIIRRNMRDMLKRW